jgi:hypothetical protein
MPDQKRLTAKEAETELREELEVLFPKGHCHNRGAALVLYAHAVLLFKKMDGIKRQARRDEA